MQSVESSNRRSVILRNWVPVKCCHELRDGCGLPTSPGLPVQVRSMRAADADWSESFSHALEAYRSAACDGLDASLAELALPPSRPSSALGTL
jgi:hypothetical protein